MKNSKIVKNDKGLALVGAATLVAFSIVLVLLVWQNVERQRRLVDEHLTLAAQVLLRGMEMNLIRGMRLMGGGPMMGRSNPPVDGGRPLEDDHHNDKGPRGGRGDKGRGMIPRIMRPPAQFNFEAMPLEDPQEVMARLIGELVDENDVRFLALIDGTGGVLFASTSDHDDFPFEDRAPAHRRKGQEHMAQWRGEPIFVATTPAHPILSRLCLASGNGECRPPAGGVRLLMGMSPEPMVGQIQGIEQTAILQTIFIVLATAGLVVLLFFLVRKRAESLRLESRLADAEKLAAVGRLAASVAHEIRNPLSSLRGFSQYFMGRFKGQMPEEEYASTMVREADRLNKVITDMLFLAKPRAMEPELVDLEGLSGELESLLQFDLKERGAVLRSDFKVGSVFADADGLKQALLNLVMNALQALPDEGGEIVVHSVSTDNGVLVSVRDNGRGMTAEEQNRALEPFYTTRKEGTGLGLSIVHTIIQEHAGRVEIDSDSENGTTIGLWFPEQ